MKDTIRVVLPVSLKYKIYNLNQINRKITFIRHLTVMGQAAMPLAFCAGVYTGLWSCGDVRCQTVPRLRTGKSMSAKLCGHTLCAGQGYKKEIATMNQIHYRGGAASGNVFSSHERATQTRMYRLITKCGNAEVGCRQHIACGVQLTSPLRTHHNENRSTG